MKLDEAILRHVVLKMEIQEAIRNRQPLANPNVGSHSDCATGRWLNDEAKAAYQDYQSFSRLLSAHVAFHRVAGMISDSIKNGDFVEAERLAGRHGEFMGTSTDLISAVSLLQAEIAAGHKKR